MGFRRAIRISSIVVTTIALRSMMTGRGLGPSDDPAENVTWSPATVDATASAPAVLPFHCIADDVPLYTIGDCPAKFRWMVDHGYEIVNHTPGHQDLLDVSHEAFAFQVGDPVLWLGDIVEGDANLMDALIMPYGNYPSRDLHLEQRAMMRNGFTREGQPIQLQAAFMVGANPTESRSRSEYDPLFIARIEASETSLEEWFGRIEDGDILVYVSGGNPNTVTIPEPVPNSLADQFDAETVVADGHQLVRHSRDRGELRLDRWTFREIVRQREGRTLGAASERDPNLLLTPHLRSGMVLV